MLHQGEAAEMSFDPPQGPGAANSRLVSQWERALLVQWFAGTARTGEQAIAAAYISERSHDHPALRNKIVIAERAKSDVTYLIHRPQGETAWVLTCGHTGKERGRFRTLPEVLNTIRPHRTVAATLLGSDPMQSEERFAEANCGV